MKVGDYVGYSIDSEENLCTIGYISRVASHFNMYYVIWFNPVNPNHDQGYYECWYIRALGGNHYEKR